MKLRSLYILSIVGLLLVIVVQIGGMMYAYDNTKKEAERALNESGFYRNGGQRD